MAVRLFYSLMVAVGFFYAHAVHAAFTFENVQKLAHAFAGEPYRQPEILAPSVLLRLDYDRYRQIRFIPERSLWRGENLKFEAQFFHLGQTYDRAVKINVIDGDRVDPVNFSPELFDYGPFKFSKKMLDRLGFAGFRLHFPLNRQDYYDEFAVFVGASYFRMVGSGQYYGLSGRGIAIDTALPSGEEFPWFREFWLVKPKPDDKTVTIFALLDGPSLAGAYQFTITPGEMTVTDVQATLFLRQPIQKLGLAPLTSMFWYGENTLSCRYDDYRPEVHDSDGLLIAMDNEEWLWRPLANEERIDVNTFIANDPKGYGLFQRDRSFDHYQDLEGHYELRPNAWIEPSGNWGKGKVELVTLPTGEESFDNIVAYWIPDQPPKPMQAFSYRYKMYWSLRDKDKPPAGYTLSTRTAKGDALKLKSRKFVLDFLGGAVPWLDERSNLKPDVSVSKEGKLIEVIPYKNKFTNGWRVDFQVAPADPLHPKPVELRVFLKSGEQALTETWTYTWHPPLPQLKK